MRLRIGHVVDRVKVLQAWIPAMANCQQFAPSPASPAPGPPVHVYDLCDLLISSS
jgi:hypothetical protein